MNKRYVGFGLAVLVFWVGFITAVRIVRGSPRPVEIEPYKIQGHPNAPTFIVLFSDFNCPYCNEIRPVLKEVLDAFPNDLKLVFKHFPLKMHPAAAPAAEASECAADQGKFWDYGDYLFDHVMDWQKAKNLPEKFTSYAGVLGLDIVPFRACLDSHVKKSIVEKNQGEGRHMFVMGTPTYLLNGRKVLTSNKPDVLKDLVKIEIEKVKTK